MKIAFNLPTIQLRCGQCLAVAPKVDLRNRRMEADIECECAIPAFELVFSSHEYHVPLAICPLVLNARALPNREEP